MLGRLVRPKVVTLSITGLLSRQTCKRYTTNPSQYRAVEPDKPSSTSEFLKSFGVLLEEPERAGVVGRWDWHLWQVFVMLLPPLGVAALAYFANYDMQKQEALQLIQKEEQQKEKLDACLTEPTQPSDTTSEAETKKSSHAEVHAKLEALEDAIKLMHVRQLIKDMTGSTRVSLAGSLQDQAMPSTTACKKPQTQPEPHASPSDSTSMSIHEKGHKPPQESKNQPVLTQDAQQLQGFSAQQDASTEPQRAAGTYEPVLKSASHTTAVETIRWYAKSQVRWLVDSIGQSFTSGSTKDDVSPQPEQQTKQKESK